MQGLSSLARAYGGRLKKRATPAHPATLHKRCLPPGLRKFTARQHNIGSCASQLPNAN